MTERERIKEQRESLPTFEYRKDLIDAIREYNVLVIIGETGKLHSCKALQAHRLTLMKDRVKRHRSLNTFLKTCQKSKRLEWHNQGTVPICYDTIENYIAKYERLLLSLGALQLLQVYTTDIDSDIC